MKILNLITILIWILLIPFNASQVCGQKQPHIIFILADDMGYSDMSFLGSGISTPNRDRYSGSDADHNYDLVENDLPELSVQHDGTSSIISIGPVSRYLEHTDTVKNFPKSRIASYKGEVVCLLFEFKMGTTGDDHLNLYIDPVSGRSILSPEASLRGEFTFDRLQFSVDGRDSCILNIDEIRLGTRLEEVLLSQKND